MIPPQFPADETQRLGALRALDILDTAPEERFDRLTRMAKRLFGVSIALVSLVDSNRQWFKSRQGLEACETSRDISFCGHAILGDDILLVPDALLDERFRDNPLVTAEPKIRFYAGCPLRVPGGSKLGTFCIIDREPRAFGEEDRKLLLDLARMAEQELAVVQMATTDDLTLLSNRRGFIALAQHALNVCARVKLPVTLFYFDLDGFKQINDRFGHAEGDRALASFSQWLLQVFRDSDVVARLGGDEFVALMTNCREAEGQAAIGRLQAGLDAHNAAARRGYDIRFSVGALSREPGEQVLQIDALLREADERMYERKRGKKVR